MHNAVYLAVSITACG